MRFRGSATAHTFSRLKAPLLDFLRFSSSGAVISTVPTGINDSLTVACWLDIVTCNYSVVVDAGWHGIGGVNDVEPWKDRNLIHFGDYDRISEGSSIRLTPAFSHFWTSPGMRRSATRCRTNFRSHSCDRLSKKLRMSQSGIQFTFFRVIATYNASSA